MGPHYPPQFSTIYLWVLIIHQYSEPSIYGFSLSTVIQHYPFMGFTIHNSSALSIYGSSLSTTNQHRPQLVSTINVHSYSALSIYGSSLSTPIQHAFMCPRCPQPLSSNHLGSSLSTPLSHLWVLTILN